MTVRRGTCGVVAYRQRGLCRRPTKRHVTGWDNDFDHTAAFTATAGSTYWTVARFTCGQESQASASLSRQRGCF